MSENDGELERLRAELQLLRYRFNLLVEHSAEAIYVKDLESRYIYINEAGARMMYQRPEQLVGRNDEGLFAPEVVAEIRADDLHVIRTGQTAVIRTARTMTTGEHLNFLTVKRPWFDADGHIIGVVGTTQDVSELVDAQREAAAATEGFRTLVEAMMELVVVHREGVVRYANPVALALFGQPESNVVGVPFAEFVRAEDRPVIDRLASDGRGRAEVGFLSEGGVVALVELSDVPGTWCGEPVRVAIGRDVSARRRMDARLRDSERLAAVGMLASGVAHEIKNPLTFVLGQGQALLAAASEPATQARLRDLVDAAERIEEIVAGVSALARPEADSPSSADVEGAVDRALLLVGARLRDRAEVRRERGGVPHVVGSERRLVQVLVNLLVNAGQALGAGPTMGTITVTTTREAGMVELRVRDSGPGVPVEMASRLFDPFVTTKPEGEGTGLGLWVCRSILAELGGSLELLNPGERGACFAVRLPVADDAPTLPPRAASPAGARPRAAPRPADVRKPRLLLVDDERLISDLLVDGLSGSFDVVATDGVDAALTLVAAGPAFDLILCDLIMPMGGGARLFDELNRRGVRPPMVFMSGGAATPESRHFLERERLTPIEKPFRIAEVRRRLLAVMDAPES